MFRQTIETVKIKMAQAIWATCLKQMVRVLSLSRLYTPVPGLPELGIRRQSPRTLTFKSTHIPYLCFVTWLMAYYLIFYTSCFLADWLASPHDSSFHPCFSRHSQNF